MESTKDKQQNQSVDQGIINEEKISLVSETKQSLLWWLTQLQISEDKIPEELKISQQLCQASIKSGENIETSQQRADQAKKASEAYGQLLAAERALNLKELQQLLVQEYNDEERDSKVEDIAQEIEIVKDDYENYKKKKATNKLTDTIETLIKHYQHQRIVQLIDEKNIHGKAFEIQQKKQLLSEEIQRMMEEHEITGKEDLYAEIERKQKEMKLRQTQKNATKKIQDLTELLAQLTAIEDKFKELDLLESESQFSNIGILQQEINQELEEHGLDDIEALKSELELQESYLAEDINDPKKATKVKKLQNIINSLKETLNKYNQLQELQNQKSINKQGDEEPKTEEAYTPDKNPQNFVAEEEEKKEVDILKEANAREELSEKQGVPNSKKLESIRQNYQNYLNMPMCVEKLLSSLQYYIILEETKGDDIIHYCQDYKQKIQDEVQLLKMYSQTEGIEDNHMLKLIDNLCSNLKQTTDLPKCLSDILVIFDNLRPFSIQEFIRLQECVDEEAELLRNKNVLVFLGQTGAGKSTTIQYLCKCDMHQTKVNKINHIEAQSKSIANQQLLKVKSSPFAQSETKFVTAIDINTSNYALKKYLIKPGFEQIVLCDTPGFGDLQGAEVDLSNGLGILRAVGQAKVIWPVMIFSYKDFGARIKEFKEQIKFYSLLFNKIEKNIGSFTYCFTCFPKEEQEQLQYRLEDLLDKLSPQEQMNENLRQILIDMLQKTSQHQVKFIDPLDAMPHTLLELILSKDPIKFPKENLEFTIGERTQNILHQQLILQRKQCVDAVKRGEIELAKFKLTEFSEFAKKLKQQNITNQFENTCKEIALLVSENYGKNIEEFDKCLEDKQILTEKEMEIINKAIKHAKAIEPIRLLIEPSNSNIKDKSYLNMQDHIKQKCQEIAAKISKADIYDSNLMKLLDKLNLIKSKINDSADIEEIYQKALKLEVRREEQIKLLREIFNREVEEKLRPQTEEFVENENQMQQLVQSERRGSISQKTNMRMKSAQHLSKIKKRFDKLEEFPKESRSEIVNKIIEQLSKIIEELSIHIQLTMFSKKNKLTKELKNWVEKEKSIQFDEKNVREIDLTFNLFAMIEENYRFLGEQTEHDIQQLSNDLVRQIVECANELFSNINQKLKTSEYELIKDYYDQLKILRAIPIIEKQIQSQFYEIFTNISQELIEKKNIIQDNLKKIEKQNSADQNQQFDAEYINNLKEALEYIQHLNWISKDTKRDFYLKAINSVKKQFKDHLENLRYQSDKYKLRIENYEQLKEVFLINKRIKSIKGLAEIIPDLQLENEFQMKIIKSLKTNIDFINSSLQSYESEEEISKIILKQDLDKLILFYQYLKEFEDFDDLPDEINTQVVRDNIMKFIKKKKDQQNKQFMDFIQCAHQFMEEKPEEEIVELENALVSRIDQTDSNLNLHQNLEEFETKHEIYEEFLFNRIKGKTFFKHWQDQLLIYSNEVEILVNKFECNEKVKFQLKNALGLLKHIDKYFPSQNKKDFSYLFDLITKMISFNPNELRSKFLDYLDNHQYERVSEMFVDLGKAGNQFAGQMNQFKNILKSHVTTLIQKVKIGPLQTQNEDENSIIESGNRLKELLQHCADYLQNKKEIETALSDLQKVLTQQLKTKCETLFNNAEKQYRFCDPEQQSVQIKEQFKKFKDIFSNQDGAHSFEQAILQECQELTKAIYISIDQYCKLIKTTEFSKLKDLVQSLPELRALPCWESQVKKIEEDILEKYKAKMIVFKDQQIQSEHNKVFKEIKTSIKFWPQYLRTEYEARLAKTDKKIKEQEAGYSKKLEEVKQSGSIQKLQEFTKHHGLKENSASAKKVFVEKGDQLLQDAIKMYRNMSTDLIENLVQLFYYEDHQEIPRSATFTKSFADLQSEIQLDFNKHYQILVSHFDEQQLSESLSRRRNSRKIKQQEQLAGQAMKFFNQFMKVYQKDVQNIISKIIPNIEDQIKSFLKNAATFLESHKKSFDLAKDKQNGSAIIKLIQQIQHSEELMKEMRDNGTPFKLQKFLHLEQSLHDLISEDPLTEDLLVLKKMIDDCKEFVIKKQFENPNTIHGEKDRSEYFAKIQGYLDFLEKLASNEDLVRLYISRYQENLQTTYEDCKKSIKTKIDDIIKKMNQSITSKNANYSDYKKQYYILKSYKENVNFQKEEVEQIIGEAEQQINQRIKDMKQQATYNYDAHAFAKSLVNLQEVSLNIDLADTRKAVHTTVEDLLGQFQKQWGGLSPAKFSELAQVLRSDGVGTILVKEHPAFEGEERKLFNKKFQTITIKEVLQQLLSDPDNKDIDTDALQLRFIEYNELYEKIVREHLTLEKIKDLKNIVANIHAKSTKNECKWDDKCIDNIPELMAHIFALWTLLNSEQFFKSGTADRLYLLQPHPAQIISIFRLLGIGYSKWSITGFVKGVKDFFKGKLYNNLIQIKTGEGKSVTLAITSIIFALHGFEVNCACYSEYLSQRDFKSFENLFALLNLNQGQIYYGTFNQICERYINKDGEVRQLTLSKVLKSHAYQKKAKQNEKPKILLIDEVDVFFSKDFYGALYTPQATIQHEKVTQLVNYLWDNQQNHLNVEKVQACPYYAPCKELFQPQYAFLLEEAIKDMLYDLKGYSKEQSHDYIFQDGRIGYKEQDQIQYNIALGYKTMFAYYYEHKNMNISKENLEKNVAININCGEFSFAEIPKDFSIILGVTGTLKTLTKSEQDIVTKEYLIQNFTFAPSVYGSNELNFSEEEIHICENEGQWFTKLVNEIKIKLKGLAGGNSQSKRAVVIFFENDKRLDKFLKCIQFKEYENVCQVLNERLTNEEKETVVKKATLSGAITLATRAFGRGTDFICGDEKVNINGGVHVFQTFLSLEQSEEVQIQGRTQRQGNKGSYSMVFLLDDLSSFDIYQKDVKANYGKYKKLFRAKRQKLQEDMQKNTKDNLKKVFSRHQKSLLFSNEVSKDQSDINITVPYLLEQNKGKFVSLKPTNTLVLMDATGSMSNLLSKAKDTVGDMFERASKVLVDSGLDPDQFLIQFAVYRNYSSGSQMILQHSPWESKPQALRSFMQTISVNGGQGREAVEIGLWHGNQESQKTSISQIFLIGDAPPNSKAEVEGNRRGRGVDHWKGTPFEKPTFYQDELQGLIAKKIPIYSFYVADWAKTEFEEIAKLTGGTCSALDVNSDSGAKMLTDLFTEQILRKIGDSNQGRGAELVEKYRKAYR